MEGSAQAHAGVDSWLTLPSVRRIAGYGLLVFALLVFYEQVKMFLYRRAIALVVLMVRHMPWAYCFPLDCACQ